MKIKCSCCDYEAIVFCCADDAAFCLQCDKEIHVNYGFSMHQRVLLSFTPASTRPKCDFCQEMTGYFICLEHRLLVCRKCDLMLHTATSEFAAHRRFLITGARVGEIDIGNSINMRNSTHGAYGISPSTAGSMPPGCHLQSNKRCATMSSAECRGSSSMKTNSEHANLSPMPSMSLVLHPKVIPTPGHQANVQSSSSNSSQLAAKSHAHPLQPSRLAAPSHARPLPPFQLAGTSHALPLQPWQLAATSHAHPGPSSQLASTPYAHPSQSGQLATTSHAQLGRSDWYDISEETNMVVTSSRTDIGETVFEMEEFANAILQTEEIIDLDNYSSSQEAGFYNYRLSDDLINEDGLLRLVADSPEQRAVSEE